MISRGFIIVCFTMLNRGERSFFQILVISAADYRIILYIFTGIGRLSFISSDVMILGGDHGASLARFSGRLTQALLNYWRRVMLARRHISQILSARAAIISCVVILRYGAVYSIKNRISAISGPMIASSPFSARFFEFDVRRFDIARIIDRIS